MPSSACAVAIAAGAAVTTARPRARCFRRMAFLPCSRRRAAGAFTVLDLVSGTEVFSTGPSAGAGIWMRVCPSVRKGPHPQLLFTDLPEPREAVRLDHQKDDDQHADDHEGQLLGGRRADRQAEGARDRAQRDRQDVDQTRRRRTSRSGVPRPPMITMNSTRKLWSMAKTSASAPPYQRNTIIAPATPQ